jgi:hypothetical protein
MHSKPATFASVATSIVAELFCNKALQCRELRWVTLAWQLPVHSWC